jgi:hypothetical protein
LDEPSHLRRGNPTDTLALLKDLNSGIAETILYQSREEGTQSPIETLDRGWGSCRDFAVLFAEATRTLGFGARLVSGYLYNRDQQGVGSRDAGSTHTWAEVYASVAPGTVGIVVLIEPLPAIFGPPQRVRAKFGDYVSSWLMPAQLVAVD